jgi:hypothetical protein
MINQVREVLGVLSPGKHVLIFEYEKAGRLTIFEGGFDRSIDLTPDSLRHLAAHARRVAKRIDDRNRLIAERGEAEVS